MAAPVPDRQTVPLSTVALVGTGVTAAIHAALLLAGVFALIWIVPRFKEMFADMRIELPVLTRLLISVSDWHRNFWYLAFPGVMGLLVFDALVYWMLARRRGTWVLSALWFVAVTVAMGLGAIVFIVLPLHLPLVTLMTAIGQGG